MSSKFIYVVACAKISFLRLSNVLLCVYTTFFFYLSVDGHLGHFHYLAIVNDAAVNMMYKYLFQSLLSVLSGMYPELLD